MVNAFIYLLQYLTILLHYCILHKIILGRSKLVEEEAKTPW